MRIVLVAASTLIGTAALAFDDPPTDPTAYEECSAWFSQARKESRDELDAASKACKRIDDGLLSPRFQACWKRVYDAHSDELRAIGRLREQCAAQARANRERVAAQERERERKREEQQRAAEKERRADRRERDIRNSPTTVNPREARAAAAVGLASLILQNLYTKRVESAVGKGSASEASKLVEENNRQAKAAFNQMRKSLSLNPLVRRIQDQLFAQLDNQVTTAALQAGNLDSLVNSILSSIPSEEKVRSSSGVQRREQAVQYISSLLDYEGQINASGRPHGMGIAAGKLDGTGSVKFVGFFEDGVMTGPGRLNVQMGESGAYSWEGRLEGNRPTGPGVRRVRNSRDTNFEVTRVGNGVVAIEYRDGSVYRGEAKGLIAHGYGELQSSLGYVQRGVFKEGLNGGAYIQRSSDSSVTLRCTTANVTSCNGVARVDKANGDYAVGTMVDGKWMGDAVQYFDSHDGWAIYEGIVVNGYREGLGLLAWEQGDYYEGEFKGNLWGRGTIGRYRYANGGVAEGRWEDDKLVDGIITYPDGDTETRGRGTRYAIKTYGTAQR